MTGASVTLAVRDVDAGRRVAHDISHSTDNAEVSVAELDPADIASVQRFAGSARIVSVSSSGHGNSPVVFDDLFFDRRPYDAASRRPVAGPPPASRPTR